MISLADDTLRRTAVSSLCDQLELPYRIVDAIRCSPGRIGCGLSHLKVLRSTSPLPLLVLEDDVGVSEAYSPLITVPDDTDAIWLGASTYGAVSLTDYVGFTDSLLLDEAEHGLLRAHNLLTTHAILYLTDRFRKAAIDAITECIADLDWDPDRGLARIQSDYNVYAVREPPFFQAADLQSPGRRFVEEATRLTLRPTDLSIVYNLVCDGVPRPAKAVRTERGLGWAWATAGD